MTAKEARLRIARRAARELRDGDIVNLGIGLPTLVADLVPSDLNVHFHTENGLLGVGPTPPPGEEDPDILNAGKQPVTAVPGAAYFDSAHSFAMIRGSHIHVAVLGALQVSQEGDIANWSVPGGAQLGVGGAMDLVVGARRVVVTMLHFDREGNCRVVRDCTLPLTARREADLLITDLAVFSFSEGQMFLEEIVPDLTVAQLRERTEAAFHLRGAVRSYV